MERETFPGIRDSMMVMRRQQNGLGRGSIRTAQCVTGLTPHSVGLSIYAPRSRSPRWRYATCRRLGVISESLTHVCSALVLLLRASFGSEPHDAARSRCHLSRVTSCRLKGSIYSASGSQRSPAAPDQKSHPMRRPSAATANQSFTEVRLGCQVLSDTCRATSLRDTATTKPCGTYYK